MDRDAMYMHRRAKYNDFSINFAIFTKALRTDIPTDGPTDRRTDIPSYRDADASKNKAGNTVITCSYIRPKTKSVT